MSRPRARPGLESLDARLVPNAPGPVAAALAGPPALVDRAFTPADLGAYARAYLASRGGPAFNPAFDFQGNGTIGQGDSAPILRGLAATTPRVAPHLALALAPGQQVTGHHPANSGGVTRQANVTVVGRTTPNSVIFTDGPAPNPNANRPTGNFKFLGRALTSDAQGYFTDDVSLNPVGHGGSVTTTAYLVHDPFGRQMVRSFPIFRVR